MPKPFEWDQAKNKILKQKRRVSFEQIIKEIEKGNSIASLPHYNQKRYRKQKIYLVKYRNYIYVIPYVEDSKKIFLKTIFASRKFTKKLLKKERK